MVLHECYIKLLIHTGAICISRMLRNCSLQVLVLSRNEIGDEGISVIAGTLCNSRIVKLYVNKCGITCTGARSLSEGLLENKTIRELVVYDNPITVEGACLILQSAVENGTCQTVKVNKECEDNDEVKKKMITLEHRKIQEVENCVYVACDIKNSTLVIGVPTRSHRPE